MDSWSIWGILRTRSHYNPCPSSKRQNTNFQVYLKISSNDGSLVTNFPYLVHLSEKVLAITDLVQLFREFQDWQFPPIDKNEGSPLASGDEMIVSRSTRHVRLKSSFPFVNHSSCTQSNVYDSWQNIKTNTNREVLLSRTRVRKHFVLLFQETNYFHVTLTK